MDNKNILILMLCLFSLSCNLHAAHNGGQSQQQSSSWWPDGKTVATQSCTGIIVGVVSILVAEYLKKPTPSPSQQALEKAEAQIPAQLREKQAEITILTDHLASQTHVYNILCAQCPNTPACQQRAEKLADLRARLLERQAPIIDELRTCIT